MKQDRRVKKTRQQLRDALVELILERGYESVKISHITERANLARATFYLHYKDKDELLTKSMLDIFGELAQEIGDMTPQSLLTFDAELRKLPFDNAKKYRDFYRVVLMSPYGVSTVTNDARSFISGHILRQLERMLSQVDTRIPLQIVANYMAGAFVSVISWWLEEGETYSSAYMAEMFYWLSLPTMNMLFGINIPKP